MSTNEKKPRRTFDREFIESAVKLVTSEGYSLAAAAWLGHSAIIANKHDWQVTDAGIARAIKPVEATAEEASDKATHKAAHKAAQKAAHKAAQQVHAGVVRSRTRNHPRIKKPQFCWALLTRDRAKLGHGPDKWAMRDSNPRHFACKANALTN